MVIVDDTALSVKWDKAARAEHYRIWLKIEGTDDALEPVASSGDTDYTHEGLPSGTLIKVAVSAVNNGGESALSEVIEVTTK